MSIWHEAHRGYRISYQGERFARILRPDGQTELDAVAEAEPGEGRVELRSKAHALIDADIAAHHEPTALR